MALDRTFDEAYVRRRALEAARCLTVIKFRGRPTGLVFGPNLSTYGDMVDPDAALPRPMEACRSMRDLVARQIVVEEIAAEEIWSGKGKLDDPYALVWRKTERGALLEMVERILAEALAGTS